LGGDLAPVFGIQVSGDLGGTDQVRERHRQVAALAIGRGSGPAWPGGGGYLAGCGGNGGCAESSLATSTAPQSPQNRLCCSRICSTATRVSKPIETGGLSGGAAFGASPIPCEGTNNAPIQIVKIAAPATVEEYESRTEIYTWKSLRTRFSVVRPLDTGNPDGWQFGARAYRKRDVALSVH